MRVSDYFRLGVEQGELDFVNVSVTDDTPVFLDPGALRQLDSPWSRECVCLIQSYFESVLDAIAAGQDDTAIVLLRGLSEPNETHLGLSSGRSRGRGVGRMSAQDLWKALRGSEAVQSRLLEDIEDTLLFIDGIGTDIISDMVTNIIREPLIHYTQNVCRYHGIPTAEVDSGPLWSPSQKRWRSQFERMPLAAGNKLLLVPKVMVRRKADFDAGEYNRHYVMEYLQQEELKAGSELVKLLKNGNRRVSKKDLEAKYGTGKGTNTRFTLLNPDLLREYKHDKVKEGNPPLSHRELAELTQSDPVNWDALLSAVTCIPTGAAHATIFEKAIEGLLAALFFPSLVNPVRQPPIHAGRKRLDLLFTNVGQDHFFGWLAQHFPAANVVVECKNYSDDIANPELDQMIGRFSMSRGKIGFIVCRALDNQALFDQRCRDAATDGHGFIIALTDADLKQMVELQKQEKRSEVLAILRGKFNTLINLP